MESFVLELADEYVREAERGIVDNDKRDVISHWLDVFADRGAMHPEIRKKINQVESEEARALRLEGKKRAAKRLEKWTASRATLPAADAYMKAVNIRLSGGCTQHELWLRVPVDVPEERYIEHPLFHRSWLVRNDFDQDIYVSPAHTGVVAVDRDPGASHTDFYVGVRNRLLLRAYAEGSCYVTPITLTRAQGGLEGWEDARAYLEAPESERERIGATLFGTWRQNKTFLSTSLGDDSLRYKATVYTVYHVEPRCPIMGVWGRAERVLPPGVEMRASSVSVESFVMPHGRVFYYVIEVDVRANKEYRPRMLPLRGIVDPAETREDRERRHRKGLAEQERLHRELLLSVPHDG